MFRNIFLVSHGFVAVLVCQTISFPRLSAVPVDHLPIGASHWQTASAAVPVDQLPIGASHWQTASAAVLVDHLPIGASHWQTASTAVLVDHDCVVEVWLDSRIDR